MTLTKIEADEKYKNLWSVMERDFDEKLDAPTYNEFEKNVAKWAGIHSSDATAEVAAPIWNTLHKPTIEEVTYKVKSGREVKGHYRDRFTGRLASKDAFEAQTKK